ncbi:MAG TPA: hypothetical protein VMU10_08050 [Desulfomonilia bacterium]|nr:hypothetical protein [Desulfomonilia bacterium]
MNISRRSTCGVLVLMLYFISPCSAQAEVSLTVSGICATTGSDLSKAEKTAFDDALYKAYLDLALRQVPASASVDLIQKIKGFIAGRGTQDIIQYQIISRSQQDNVLILNLDLKINDAPLKDWLKTHAFTTPLGLRPSLLLTITTRGPGPAERYEWWSSSTPKGYSPFETQLAARLRNAGENIIDVPQHISLPPASSDKTVTLASNLGASLLITGILTHKPSDATGLDSRLEISLIDVKMKRRITSSFISLKGTLDVKTMNELLITGVLDQIRSEIAKKVVVVTPVMREKGLCIEGIKDYETYDAIINAVRSLDTVAKISVSSIQGHSICHAIQIKGSLQDILDSLKQKKIAQADMLVEDNIASIRLLNP